MAAISSSAGPPAPSTASRCDPVVKHCGSANSSIAIACSQDMSAAPRSSGFIIVVTWTGSCSMRSHHARAAAAKLVVGVHRVGQAQLGGVGSRELRPAREELERALVAQATGEQPARADLRQQTDPAERGHKSCSLGDEDQVAGERKREAHPGRCAVDRRHEGLVGARDQPRDAAELHPDPAPQLGCAAPAGEHRPRAVAHQSQVAARGEGRVGAGQHDRAERLVRRQLGEHVAQPHRELRAQWVEPVGSFSVTVAHAPSRATSTSSAPPARASSTTSE